VSDRFELLGVLGRGGTATVHLATDALRGHQVALKVVHPHLADDPTVQRRLRREVAAASLIQHEAALVPFDLHEVDGSLALSMPWHPGETLADRVAHRGKLAAHEVRQLGTRLAGALAASHRAGVLHRDVSAANVLLEEPGDAVLTDFGLARVTRVGTQATTGLLGTAGYAAPEVYSGSRSDPRSDLYGLGAVLYLAATGIPAFDPKQPMAALKAQLDDEFVPVKQLAPDLDDDVARAIEAMLRADPEERPDGASAALEWLEGRREPPPTAQASRAEAAVADGRAEPLRLPEGDYTLLVVERGGDRMRRDELRAAQRGRRRNSFEQQMSEVGRHIAQGLLGLIGLSLDDDEVSPEQLLADAVAEEAGLAPGTLMPNIAMLDKRFRLVERTDEATVRRLRARARAAGFDTEVHRLRSVPGWLSAAASFWWVGIFPLLLFVQSLPPSLRATGWMLFVFLMVMGGSLGSRAQVQRRLAGRSIAFATGRAPVAVSPETAQTVSSTPAEAAPQETEGQRLRRRAFAGLDALDATLEAADHVPEVALIDLRATSRRLRDAAERLAERHDALADVLESQSPTDDVAGLSARLARLDTLERAGKPVDGRERQRLEAALAQHAADEAAAEQVESELIATQAQLIELASTASRVRRELVQSGPRTSADQLVDRLRREADAVDRARREAAARQARRQ